MSSPPMLQIESVTKRFGNHAALDRLSFEVHEGEIVALLGDNGAGKSTLVKCIAGVYRPDSGCIRVNSRPLQHDKPPSAQGIGIVYQDLALFDNLSVGENLFAGSEPRWPRFLGPFAVIKRRSMFEEARATLDRLEVRLPNLKTPVGLLSGGQRQAIAVSKGIAFAKRVVVLDEPTAALGLRERRNVLDLVRQLPSTDIAVILISHNLEEVVSVANRAVVLRQGKKVGEVDATLENREKIVSLIVGAESTPEFSRRAKGL
ncbi:ABC transporter [Candidatus Protofrankia californiensis]|uniref:ABC transporter n=1 Tax=Candidatus Protofrankia californiensis TaxID=1839754 RepID=A0A1C3NXU8_9ACTN|nr:ABC transporter [Candidatus Protofrankia californiensis]